MEKAKIFQEEQPQWRNLQIEKQKDIYQQYQQQEKHQEHQNRIEKDKIARNGMEWNQSSKVSPIDTNIMK